jgi:hypothetical protein
VQFLPGALEMASEIYKEKVYGDFRVRRSKQPKEPSSRSERPGNSEHHLFLIRQMPCSVCLVSRPTAIIDPHHLRGGEAAAERGVGMRASDKWAVPLCRMHHDALHRISSRREKQWFYDGGIDPYDLAVALWVSTGDIDRMNLILLTQREHFGQVD